MARVALVLLLLFAPLSAFAAGFGTVRISAPTSVTTSIDTGTFESLLAKPSTVGMSGTFRGLIAGRAILVQGIRLIPSSVIVSLAVTAAMEYGPSALAFAINLVWDDDEKKWKKPESGSAEPEGKWQGNAGDNYSSPTAVCQHYCDCYALRVNDNVYSCRYNANGGMFGYVSRVVSCPLNYKWDVILSSCVAYELVDASRSDVAAKVSPPITSSVPTAVSQASILKGLPVPGLEGLLASADPVDETSGPEGVVSTEETQTTTDLSGQTTTATTTSYAIDYEGDLVKVTTTETTITTYPDNTTQTVTRTNTSNEPRENVNDPSKSQPGLCDQYPNIAACQIAGSGDDGNDQEDYCVQHPESPACLPVGSLSDETLPTATKDLSIISELSATGTCPADIPLSILGYEYAISWQPVCTFATGIRPYILIGCWLGAVLFVFGIAARTGD